MHIDYSATVQDSTCIFTENLQRTVSSGALSSTSLIMNVGNFTIHGISIISDFDSASVGTFRQNSAVTGGGAISTVNSALTISGASFSDNTAGSGGDAIHACSSEVTVESSDGLSSGNMAGQCLLFDNFPGASTSGGNFPGTSTSGGNFLGTNGGVSQYYYYVINLPLISLNFVMLVALIMY